MKKILRLLVLFLISLSFGCQKTTDSTQYSSTTVALTDAACDELDSFEVDITGIILKKAGGQVVNALTKKTRVDFVALNDFSELIVGGPLPAGFYTGATFQLDFSTAKVLIKGKTNPAAIKDAAGNTLSGTVDVAVNFFSFLNFLVGKNHLLQFDLDLNSAVTVDDPGNTVTFIPTITAKLDPNDGKGIISTGYLYSVDTVANTFVLEKRAFDGTTVIGRYTVEVTAPTVFHLSGTGYAGAIGLNQLTGLIGNRIFVRGTVDPLNRILQASIIEAGLGTLLGTQDWVEGLITARAGGAGADANLTVLGRSLQTGGTRTYNTAHTVNVSFANTKVLTRGSNNSINTDALSIGQRIIAFGSLSGNTLDSTVLNDGVVRMVRSDVFATANGPASGNILTVNVKRFGLRDVSLFTFTGAGTPLPSATAYKVDVTGINTSGITADTPIRIIGFVNPVDTTNNFKALAVVNYSDLSTFMFCDWATPNSGAITASTSAEITLDVSAATIAKIDNGFLGSGAPANNTPKLAPKDLLGLYVIFESTPYGPSIQVHFTFADFANSINAKISTGTPVKRVQAIGSYDSGTNTFSGKVMWVVY